VTVSKLAGLLGLERTTLTRNLRPLEACGWIHELPDESDHRRRRLVLTPVGRSAAAKALPAWRKAQATVGPILDRFGLRISTARDAR
jgi:DNA-binding MarR family transcriptional regulator